MSEIFTSTGRAPPRDVEGLMGNICQFCGAYSRRSCEMEDEFGVCPLDADPDWLREDRDERRQLEREWVGSTMIDAALKEAEHATTPMKFVFFPVDRNQTEA